MFINSGGEIHNWTNFSGQSGGSTYRKDKEKFRSARKIMRNENRLYGKINMAKKLSWKLCNLSSKR
jgi:hypothetical protein